MSRRVPKQELVAAAFGLGVLSFRPLTMMGSRPGTSVISALAAAGLATPCCSPSELARRIGWRYRIRAKLAVNRELEALEEWDPEAMQGPAPELCRRQLLARDRDGVLRRAQWAAQQAAILARNPDEAYRATLLLAYLASDAGDHQTELKLAQKMVTLQPRSEPSLAALWHAARSNGMDPLTCQAMVALHLLREAPEQVTQVNKIGARHPVPRGPGGVSNRAGERGQRGPEH